MTPLEINKKIPKLTKTIKEKGYKVASYWGFFRGEEAN